MGQTLTHKEEGAAPAIDLIILTNGQAGLQPTSDFFPTTRPAGLTSQEGI